MANTKLTPEQKAELKEMKDYLKDLTHWPVNVVNLDNKTTMAYCVMGNTVEFSLSVMSADEEKFRRKVGEYYALDRFNNDQTVKMDKFDFQTMTENVWDAYLIE